MKVAVSEAKAQLTELVRRAEEGEEVVLTRHGRPVIRLQPVVSAPSLEEQRAVVERIRAAARLNPSPGPCAARSQDFLYDDETGLPA